MAAPIALREDFDGLALRVLARKTRIEIKAGACWRLLRFTTPVRVGKRRSSAYLRLSLRRHLPQRGQMRRPCPAVLQQHGHGFASGRDITGRGARRSLSAQFYAAVVKAHPDIPSEIGVGELSRLHAWLREHLYQHGHKFRPHEVVERTTGGPMSIKPFLAYLRAKYGELYQLPYVEAR